MTTYVCIVSLEANGLELGTIILDAESDFKAHNMAFSMISDEYIVERKCASNDFTNNYTLKCDSYIALESTVNLLNDLQEFKNTILTNQHVSTLCDILDESDK